MFGFIERRRYASTAEEDIDAMRFGQTFHDVDEAWACQSRGV